MSRLARIGLGAILLLQAVGCGTVGDLAAHLGPARLPAWPESVPTPSPWARWELPGLLTPFVPPSPPPSPTATATPLPPTPTPSRTPLPTATAVLSLDQLRAQPIPPTKVLGHGIQLPPGFKIDLYAQGVKSASYMAYSPDGVLFVSQPDQGTITALPDRAGKGQAESAAVFAGGLTQPTGLAFFGGYLYVAEAQQVIRFAYTPGQLHATTAPEVVVHGLPAGGSNPTHAIGFGPDGLLYLTIPASCNACREADPRRATIMRYQPDGSHEEVFAQGLRDAEGLIWYPNSPNPLVTNSNRRRMGEDLPPDTIEIVAPQSNFGWPFCHAGDIVDPELGWEHACDGVPHPFVQLPAHTTPRGLCAYQGSQFPSEYYGSIFVALSGSWERKVPTGYEIVRLKLQNGQVAAVEHFASGWLVQEQAWGRPVDVVQAPDGSLLVSDDWAGAVYRIHYQP